MIMNHKNLKVIFWNARSIIPRKEEICKILPDHYPGFKTFRKDREHSRGGGIVAFIRNNLAYTEINSIKTPDDSVELTGIKITNISPPINIFICYRPQESR